MKTIEDFEHFLGVAFNEEITVEQIKAALHHAKSMQLSKDQTGDWQHISAQLEDVLEERGSTAN